MEYITNITTTLTFKISPLTNTLFIADHIFQTIAIQIRCLIPLVFFRLKYSPNFMKLVTTLLLQHAWDPSKQIFYSISPLSKHMCKTSGLLFWLLRYKRHNKDPELTSKSHGYAMPRGLLFSLALVSMWRSWPLTKHHFSIFFCKTQPWTVLVNVARYSWKNV